MSIQAPDSADSEPKSAIGKLWQELLAGSLKVESVRGEGFELVLASAVAPAPTQRRARRQACFERALRGEQQKSLAADFEKAPSTLSGLVRSVAAEMGISAPLSKIPSALPLLTHAARSTCVVSLCEVGAERDPSQRWLLSFSYHDKILEAGLSSAEREVVRRYVRGQSYAQIAGARGTSYRTIANQLASAFGKLRVTGRLSLIRYIVECGAALGAPVTVTLRAVPRLETRTASPQDEQAWPLRQVNG
ncbi:MAG TPA: helix-turn-helix transcriptional regulator [Polyangiaceae bacterium]|nr:helix-turn-helix transcriptional regulator [Polyangiaceae bacterium]